jgi:glutamine amidotransferase
MSAKVTVLDYGMGNLHSVVRALDAAGAEVRVAGEVGEARGADRLVVPGQGAFGECMRRLEATGLGDLLRQHWSAGRPYLGICLGLQVLFESSEEQGPLPGFGLLRGQVRRLGVAKDDARIKVPHMGWNAVYRTGDHPVFRELDGRTAGSWFYFVHSYAADAASSVDATLVCEYGSSFCAGVAKGPLVALQFHPEKSQRAGQALLRRFMAL